jgi:cardiolipin synthase
MNIGDEYWKGSGKEPAYRDLQMAVRGPILAELIWQFVQDWFFATGEALNGSPYLDKQAPVGSVSVQVVAGGPDTELNEMQLSMQTLLHRAKKRVWMMTPYFVPEAPLISALVLAAMRGVEVRLMVPQRGDHAYLTAVTRSYYDQLLPHGVRIYEYRPGMLHAKLTLIDDHYSMGGSANLDVRSLRINFELNLIMACPNLNSQLVRLFERDFAVSDRIRWGPFQNRPFSKKLAEVICRPLAPLL